MSSSHSVHPSSLHLCSVLILCDLGHPFLTSYLSPPPAALGCGTGVEEEPPRLWALTRRPSPSSCQVVSFFSLKSDSAPPWMVLAVLWCSMAQTLLLPSFIWSCERYRADVRTVWEQCVAIMSEEDGEDGQRRGWAFALPRHRLSFLPFSTSSSRGWGGAALECPLLDRTCGFLWMD